MAGSRKAKILVLMITASTLLLLYNSIEATHDHRSYKKVQVKEETEASDLRVDSINEPTTDTEYIDRQKELQKEEASDLSIEADDYNESEELEMVEDSSAKLTAAPIDSSVGGNEGNMKKQSKKVKQLLDSRNSAQAIAETPKENIFKSMATHEREALDKLCQKTMWQTLNSCAKSEPPGFIITGDIADMWIRDSAAQVNNYIELMDTREDLHDLLLKVVERQAFFIKFDPYANSYRSTFNKHPTPWEQSLNRHGWVATGNYELDSGAYFFKLTWKVWKKSGILVDVHEAVKTMIDLWIVEQNHETESQYRYSELSRGGKGSPTGYTGMTWSGFRPSDDPCTHHYNIPDNVFAAVSLGYAKEMLLKWDDQEYYKKATKLKGEIEKGIAQHGLTEHNGKTIYCYEVDGLGKCNKMDDANVPSLLGLPYIDPKAEVYDHQIYKDTFDFIMSSDNPFYVRGHYKTEVYGIGSPHTPRGRIWHMAMIMEALLSNDDQRKLQIVRQIMDSTIEHGGSMHESFDPDYPGRFTRHWFAWADTLFAEGPWCDGARDP